MAPIITITIHALLSSIGLRQQHQPSLPISVPDQVPAPIDTSSKPCHEQSLKAAGATPGSQVLSAISWGQGRNDIYGLDPESGNLTHKYWDGNQWGPSGNTLEDLGGSLRAAPAAVSWGKDRMDIFSLDPYGFLIHKYWDGKGWKPDALTFDYLGGRLIHGTGTLAATSWGENRLDVFGIGGSSNGGLVHKFWDGSQWNPEENFENLGGRQFIAVSAVSWGQGRLDVFAADLSGSLLHIYYDGTGWADWEVLPSESLLSEPTVISWGENRLDVFAIDFDTGSLMHIAWDGSQWLPWDNLGGSNLVGRVAAISWGPNRMDVVALGEDGVYYYKFWDGHQWNPTDYSLYPKGANFTSLPVLSSWGANRLDIFGVTSDEQLAHQTWYGSGWYPEWTFEKLGGPLGTPYISTQKMHKEL